jgi:hypothetical protein
VRPGPVLVVVGVVVLVVVNAAVVGWRTLDDDAPAPARLAASLILGAPLAVAQAAAVAGLWLTLRPG